MNDFSGRVLITVLCLEIGTRSLAAEKNYNWMRTGSGVVWINSEGTTYLTQQQFLRKNVCPILPREKIAWYVYLPSIRDVCATWSPFLVAASSTRTNELDDGCVLNSGVGWIPRETQSIVIHIYTSSPHITFKKYLPRRLCLIINECFDLCQALDSTVRFFYWLYWCTICWTRLSGLFDAWQGNISNSYHRWGTFNLAQNLAHRGPDENRQGFLSNYPLRGTRVKLPFSCAEPPAPRCS